MTRVGPVALQRLVACLLVVLLAGCGWQLRGTVGGGLADVPVQVTGDTGSRLGERVSSELANLGARVVSDAAQARLVVEVADASRSRRTVATGDRGFATEREVTYRLRFRVRPGGEAPPEATSSPLQTVTTRGAYPVDPDNLQASEAEEDALAADLRDDAIRLMLSRVARSL